MLTYPPTIVLRHRKENIKKCSLRGLEERADFAFYTYPCDPLPPLDGYLVLGFDGPVLSEKESAMGLFIIDGTWRYAGVMAKNTPELASLPVRSLPPSYRTAYPRKQADCPDPVRGLASIEAIYIAYKLMGRDPKGLLDNYHWKEAFLVANGLYRSCFKI